MKNYASLLVALVLLLTPLTIFASTLHVILVCDTLAENIEASVHSDMKHMETLAKKICKYTQYKLAMHTYSDTRANVLAFQSIKSLAFGSNDIVLFYFSGHGYNLEPPLSKWPNLALTTSYRGIDYHQLYQDLKSKKPRLLIAVADCCNSILPPDCAPPVVRAGAEELREKAATKKKNCRSLFIQLRGSMIASSSAYGEFSWALNSGGIFTNCFIESFDRVINGKNASWDKIFEMTRKKVMTYKVDRKKKDSPYIKQTPQYMLEIKRT